MPDNTTPERADLEVVRRAFDLIRVEARALGLEPRDLEDLYPEGNPTRRQTEPDECDYCRAFRFRDWDTVGRLQEERGGPDKACRCDF